MGDQGFVCRTWSDVVCNGSLSITFYQQAYPYTMIIGKILITIMLHVCLSNAIVPPKYIRTTYNSIGLLNRNGSTSVDCINLLRCINNHNVGGDIVVGVSQFNELVVIQEGNLTNKSSFKDAAVICYKVIGFSLSFQTRYNLTDVNDLTIMGNLADSVSVDHISSFQNVDRNRVIYQ